MEDSECKWSTADRRAKTETSKLDGGTGLHVLTMEKQEQARIFVLQIFNFPSFRIGHGKESFESGS